MKNIVCAALTVAAAVGLLAGCAPAGRLGTMDAPTDVPASPAASASPLIATPDPANGEIRDRGAGENGMSTRPNRAPAGSASPSPATEMMR